MVPPQVVQGDSYPVGRYHKLDWKSHDQDGTCYLVFVSFDFVSFVLVSFDFVSFVLVSFVFVSFVLVGFVFVSFVLVILILFATPFFTFLVFLAVTVVKAFNLKG